MSGLVSEVSEILPHCVRPCVKGAPREFLQGLRPEAEESEAEERSPNEVPGQKETRDERRETRDESEEKPPDQSPQQAPRRRVVERR